MPSRIALGLSLHVGAAFLAGCLTEDEPAHIDLDDLALSMRWAGADARTLEVRVRNVDIPCEGVEKDLLSESGVQCTSAPWRLEIDGVAVETTPITCVSAHEGFFDFVPKRCEGGHAIGPVLERPNEDVEIFLANDHEERRFTVPGVRKRYVFVEEAPFQSTSKPGIVRVDGLVLTADTFTAWYTPTAGGAAIRSTAKRDADDASRLTLSPGGTDRSTAYTVKVNAQAKVDVATIAIELEGTLTTDR